MPLFAAYLTQASHGVVGRVVGGQTVSIRTVDSVPGPGPGCREWRALPADQAVSDAATFTAMALAYLENTRIRCTRG